VEPFRTSTVSRAAGVAEGVGDGERVVAVGVGLGVPAVVAAAVGDAVRVVGAADVVAAVVGALGSPVVTPGEEPTTPSPLSKPPPHEENATSNAMTAATAISP